MKTMMWDFVRNALYTGKYSESLHIVVQDENSCLFAVKAINQKVFLKNTAQLDESWNLFLVYSKHKLGSRFVKPDTPVNYTKLRSRFFNGLIRCACSGTIRRLENKELESLNLTDKNFKYYLYVGTRLPGMVDSLEIVEPLKMEDPNSQQQETFEVQTSVNLKEVDFDLRRVKLEPVEMEVNPQETDSKLENLHAVKVEPGLAGSSETTTQDTNVQSIQMSPELEKSQLVEIKPSIQIKDPPKKIKLRLQKPKFVERSPQLKDVKSELPNSQSLQLNANPQNGKISPPFQNSQFVIWNPQLNNIQIVHENSGETKLQLPKDNFVQNKPQWLNSYSVQIYHQQKTSYSDQTKDQRQTALSVQTKHELETSHSDQRQTVLPVQTKHQLETSHSDQRQIALHVQTKHQLETSHSDQRQTVLPVQTKQLETSHSDQTKDQQKTSHSDQTKDQQQPSHSVQTKHKLETSSSVQTNPQIKNVYCVKGNPRFQNSKSADTDSIFPNVKYIHVNPQFRNPQIVQLNVPLRKIITKPLVGSILQHLELQNSKSIEIEPKVKKAKSFEMEPETEAIKDNRTEPEHIKDNETEPEPIKDNEIETEPYVVKTNEMDPEPNATKFYEIDPKLKAIKTNEMDSEKKAIKTNEMKRVTEAIEDNETESIEGDKMESEPEHFEDNEMESESEDTEDNEMESESEDTEDSETEAIKDSEMESEPEAIKINKIVKTSKPVEIKIDLQNSKIIQMHPELQNIKPGETLICVSNDVGGLRLLKNPKSLKAPQENMTGLDSKNAALLKCPLSFEVHTPRNSSGWAVNLALEEEFGLNCLLGVCPFSSRKFWVTARNQKIADKFYRKGYFTLLWERVRLFPVDKSITVTIRDCPLEVAPKHLSEALAPYGFVLEHEYVAYHERSSLLMGIRRLKFQPTMNSAPVPNLLTVNGFRVQVTYPGMVLHWGGNGPVRKKP